VSGIDVPALHSFDKAVAGHMERHHIPGGAVAVVKDGRLLYARGFGYADREAGTPVQPTSRFRMASVSKPITAVAMVVLMQERHSGVTPETKVFRYLGLQPFLKPGEKEDPRIWQITVRQLLQHTAGWDRDRSGDQMFQHFQVARDMQIPSPPDHTSLIRWAMGRPLDFDPGTRYAYSNFGYCVLGRVIEKASGLPYERFVREKVLAPLGVTHLQIGRGRRSQRLPGEVCYYDGADRPIANVFSTDPEREAPTPYGFASPETMDAHGGWIGSAVELARFAAALDGAAGRRLLSPASVALLYARPPAPVARTPEGGPTDVFYGGGWNVRTVGYDGRANYWHTGSMPGTSSILVRLAGGLSWVALFNSRDGGNEIDGMLHRAAAGVTTWPEHDLFPRYR
jgi:N-acyl-D-amino-acid deacylase